MKLRSKARSAAAATIVFGLLVPTMARAPGAIWITARDRRPTLVIDEVPDFGGKNVTSRTRMKMYLSVDDRAELAADKQHDPVTRSRELTKNRS